MFKKETACLRCLVTFFTANAMLLNNEIKVGHNVPAGDRPWQQIRIMRKNKTHLLQVIADGSGRIMFGSEHCMHLLQ